MIQFQHNDKEYLIPESADELTLDQVINIFKLEERTKKMSIGEEMYAIQSLDILTKTEGEFDDIGFAKLMVLIPYIKTVLEGMNNIEIPTVNERIVWEIGGKKFSHRWQEDIPIGEVIDMKSYVSNKVDEYSYLMDVVTILIRPVQECLTESGNKYIKLIVDKGDFETNKELISKNIKYKDVVAVANFFLTGPLKLMDNTADSLKIKKVV